MSTPQIIQSRIKESWTAITCPACQTEIEYFPATVKQPSEPFAVACAKCGNHIQVTRPKAKAAKGSRRIGTGELLVCSRVR